MDEHVVFTHLLRMKVLSEKQKLHDLSKGLPSTTTTTEPDGAADTPSTRGISSQPLPPISESTPPTSHTPATSTSRPATPLEKTLLELLSDADLGATGFLKANELKAVLLKPGKVMRRCYSETYDKGHTERG